MNRFKLFSLLLLLTLAISNTLLAGTYSGGTGTDTDPYQIATADDLIELGNTTDDYSCYFQMTKDIDLSNYTFDKAVIAWDTDPATDNFQGYLFQGSFDGNGHVITNLVINNPNADFLGVFGNAGGAPFTGIYGAVIKNLGVENVYVNGHDYVGGIAGSVEDVLKCFVSGNISCHSCGGAIAGNSSGGFINCYSSGSVAGIDNIGGIVGKASYFITMNRCYSLCNITGDSFFNGLIGNHQMSTIYYSFYNKDICGYSVSQSDQTAKTTEEMKDFLTYVDTSWDFSGVDGDVADWKMLPGEYPVLAWEISDEIEVPDLTGLSYSEAMSELELIGMQYSLHYDYSYLEAGLICSQTPSVGTDYMIGCEVELTVSLGGFLSGGLGTESDPYQVSTVDDLLWMADTPFCYDRCFILTSDIDLNGLVFSNSLIAANENTATDYSGNPFCGTFDGNCHKISNLTIENTTNTYTGLFGYIGQGGAIINLSLEHVNITGDFIYVGGICGYIKDGTIDNSYVLGYLVGNNIVGGLCGYCKDSTINNCYVLGSVIGNENVGGLCGVSSSSYISTCYDACNVVCSGVYLGGLVGNNYGSIRNCFWDKDYSGVLVGVGYGYGTIMGSNTSEMQTLTTFTDAGWDFSDADGDDADWQMPVGWYPILATESSVELAPVVDLANLTLDQAQVALSDSGMSIGIVSYIYSSIDAGLVYRQFPVADTPWLNGCPVNITISLGTVYSGGNGTEADPFILSSADDLVALGNNPAHYGEYFVVTNDIDMAGHVFMQSVIAPDIDSTTSDFHGTQFTGKIEGNGFSIDNLTISSSGFYVGLFGSVGVGGNINNLSLTNVNVFGAESLIGGLVGQNFGEITSCSVSGQIMAGNYNAGGICGNNSGTISQCWSDCSVSGQILIGGLCGVAVGNLSECYATGNISGDSRIGGLAGSCNNGIITNCYAAGGSVEGQFEVGGLCGYNNTGNISNSFAAIPTIAVEASVGGLCGYSSGTVSGCFWDTEVSGQAATIGEGIGLTTTQMQQRDCYIIEQWFGNIWTLPLDSYPHLAWELVDGEVFDIIQLAGSGTVSDPWQISSLAELTSFGVNSQISDDTFILTSDIDCSGYVFDKAMIASDENSAFTGIFDGNGHSISNLVIHSEQNNYVGLFGYVESSAVVKNLTLTNVSIHNESGSCTGALCGYNHSSYIDNCNITGEIIGGANTGGLCGDSSSEITNCSFSGVIRNTGGINVGGICGQSSGKIMNCSSGADIKVDAFNVGGICGDSTGTISACVSSGSVSGTYRVGGIAGFGGAFVKNCYVTATVNSTYSNLYTIGPRISYVIGGICGVAATNISNCYAVGPITSDVVTSGVITLSKGGICGPIAYDHLQPIVNCFWDIEATGVSEGYEMNDYTNMLGVDLDGIVNLVGMSTEAMQNPLIYQSFGWTDGSWTIEQGSYPRLAWENAGGDIIEVTDTPFTGSGTDTDPYQISNAAELISIGQQGRFCAKAYKLNSDIDLSMFKFYRSIIGDDIIDKPYFTNRFYGSFDGAGHTISNLNIDALKGSYIGLFGYVNGGTISNLGLKNIALNDFCNAEFNTVYIGGLCGMCVSGSSGAGGDISNCFVTGLISGGSGYGKVGGLCGSITGDISCCFVDVDISNENGTVGGLCAISSGNIDNSYAHGKVYGYSAGGFCGRKYGGNVNNCYSTCEVTGDDFMINGFGNIDSRASITNSFWDVQTSGIGNSGDDNNGATGKTTSELQTLATFTSSGWDFTEDDGNPAIWQIFGDTYPTLAWEVNFDIDASEFVDLADFAVLAANWLSSEPPALKVDFDKSGTVELGDLELFTQYWMTGVFYPSPLLGYWQLDETEGTTAVDSSDYCNDGQVIGSPTRDTGIVGGCYTFNGSSDYVLVEGCQGVSGSKQRTVTAFIKANEDLANQDGNIHNIVTWGDTEGVGHKWFIALDGSTGQLALGTFGGRLKGGPDLEDGQWHHIAVVLPDGANNLNQVLLYVDGEMVTTNAGEISSLIDTTATEVIIGAMDRAAADATERNIINFFAGSIDEVHIYNTALSSDEIFQMAN